METWKQNINHVNDTKPSVRSKTTINNAPCKRHQKHRQSPGVCSICLSERLSQLAKSTAERANFPSYSSSSCSYLSSLSSSCSSPVTDLKGKRKSGRVLKKSRSMAFFLQKRKGKGDEAKGMEIKGGFWSKLLKRSNKGLMHSRTTRERVVTAIH